MVKALEDQFTDAMRDLYRLTKEATKGEYRPTRHLQSVNNHGGVDTAKRRLREKPRPGGGLERITAIGRLDLSVECLVIQHRWRRLFTAEELDIARQRLRDRGMEVTS
jgi:hypothetical protein